MWVQETGLFLIGVMHSFGWWLLVSALLGLGTAMVYPTLIAAVSDASHPSWRARSLSVYCFWRDLGYAIGALSAGVIADALGLAWAIRIIAALSFLSGAVVALLMRERSAHERHPYAARLKGMKTLFIFNDPPYGTERVYNALPQWL
jgi:MFS family permease